jgi:hypothetical protein
MLHTFGEETDTHATLKHINTQAYRIWFDRDSNTRFQYLSGQLHLSYRVLFYRPESTADAIQVVGLGLL